MSLRILVCDAEQRATLAVVRSLGRQGHTIAVCSHNANAIAAASRWTSRDFRVPDSVATPYAFVASVRHAATVWKADIVIPVTDQSSRALLRSRKALAPAIIPGPTMQAFERASDKSAVLVAARTLGIDVPQHFVIDGADADLSRIDSLRAPFVLKSARQSAFGRHVVTYAADPGQVADQLAAMSPEAFPVIVQERIIGPGVGVFLLMHDRKLIAAFAHERVREDPPSGGSSVYAKSIALPKSLRDASARLLRAHHWEGVAMIEFKRETATGRHFLMEVNGRFWGSLQLAIDAGVDFPALLVNATRGVVPDRHPTYKEGVRLRSFWRDLGHLLTRLRHTPASLDLAPNTRDGLFVIADFLRWSPQERPDVFRWNDIRPFVRESVAFFATRFARRSRAVAEARVAQRTGIVTSSTSGTVKPSLTDPADASDLQLARGSRRRPIRGRASRAGLGTGAD